MKKSTQIGGKGTMRRKKIPANFKRNFNKKKTQEQINFERRLEIINKYNINIDTEYKQVAIQGQNDIILNHFEDLEKHDVKKKEIYKLIKSDVISYFENKFITKEPNYQYKKYIYDEFKDIFISDCIPYILDIFIEIENYLESKKYLIQEKDVVEMGDKECFDLLGLDFTDNPTKEILKRAYKTKTKENHPDKHPEDSEKYEEIFSKISVAYKLLKDRYKI
jgi:hypothetical protein